MLNIIVPVRDNATWLSMCLTALHSWTASQYTVTIVDNQSSEEETKKLLREFAQFEADRRLRGKPGKIMPISLEVATEIPLIVPHNNASFSSSINAAVQQIPPRPQDYLVFLNSDVIVSRNWDVDMLADLADSKVGLAGARTQSGAAAGWQGDPDGALLSRGTGGGNGSDTVVNAAAQGPGIDPPFLIFLCVMLRRAVWEQVGQLDGETCQGWGGGEDLDYSWRLKDAGYRLAISRAQVIHGCNQTYIEQGLLNAEAGDLPPKAKMEQANLTRLVAKHGVQRVNNNLATRPIVLLGLISRTPMAHWPFVQSLMAAMRCMTSYGMHIEVQLVTRTFVNVAREKITDFALNNKATTGQDFTHLIFVDDDQVFQPDAFMRLIRADKDVVAPVVYMRYAPYGTAVFEWTEAEKCEKQAQEAADPDTPARPAWKPGSVPLATTKKGGYSSIEGLENTGLRRVDAVGFGMVCMKVEALKRIKRELKKKDEKAVLYPFADFGEDMSFCQLANANGAQVWCDSNCIIGHLGEQQLIDFNFKQKFVREHGPQVRKTE